ncbi:hypothetical protein [Kineococcus glutinatus]|uniref:DUF4253 domain-containing protein n=1 Tax=Kineococcus glutinatus TaxID=1070872 RepID=A0ABP9HBL5_9ACTN
MIPEYLQGTVLRQVTMFLRTQYAVEDVLDPREAFEVGLSSQRVDLPQALAEWTEFVEGAESEEDFERLKKRIDVAWTGPVEGTTYRPWFEWAGRRLREVVEHPETLIDPDISCYMSYLDREGYFLDDESQERAVEELVLQHEARIEEWLAREDGGRFLHISGDLGWRVGDLSRPDAHENVYVEVPTTRAAVVLRRADPGEELPVTAWAAYPIEPEEPAGAHWVRRRWPELEQLLGGYFGQHGAQHGSVWPQQYRLLTYEHPPLLATMRRSLGELLLLEDSELGFALNALGCYLDAPHIRLWLEWMVWRMDTFTWQ